MPALQTSYPLGQPAGFPGMHADMAEWDARTRTATAAIDFGAPVQRSGAEGCAPLTSGEYLGIAGVRRLTGATGDGYAQGDNVPVADEGCFFGTADGSIAVGAALNWNATNKRWTTASVAGQIYAVPQAEAETPASGAGALFKVRLRRIPS